MRSPPPLDLLARPTQSGAFLTPEQIAAAKRLQRDFERAHLRQRLTRDLSAPPGGRGGAPAAHTPHAAALDARRRCLDALAAAGPGLSDLLFETICMEHGLGDAERQFGWPARSAKAILALALDRLALYYGLTSGRRSPGRIERWRDATAAEAATEQGVA